MLRAPRRLEFAPVVGREAEAREESGLESPDRMHVGEQVALKLLLLDDGVVDVRQPHPAILASSPRCCSRMPNDTKRAPTRVARRVGCIWMLARLPARCRALRHERPQHRVDTGLVPRALSLEPVEHVGIDAERNRLLRHRLDDLRRSPEIVGHTAQLARRGALDRGLGNATQPRQIDTTAARCPGEPLFRTSGAHHDGSLLPKCFDEPGHRPRPDRCTRGFNTMPSATPMATTRRSP